MKLHRVEDPFANLGLDPRGEPARRGDSFAPALESAVAEAATDRQDSTLDAASSLTQEEQKVREEERGSRARGEAGDPGAQLQRDAPKVLATGWGSTRQGETSTAGTGARSQGDDAVAGAAARQGNDAVFGAHGSFPAGASTIRSASAGGEGGSIYDRAARRSAALAGGSLSEEGVSAGAGSPSSARDAASSAAAVSAEAGAGAGRGALDPAGPIHVGGRGEDGAATDKGSAPTQRSTALAQRSAAFGSPAPAAGGLGEGSSPAQRGATTADSGGEGGWARGVGSSHSAGGAERGTSSSAESIRAGAAAGGGGDDQAALSGSSGGAQASSDGGAGRQGASRETGSFAAVPGGRASGTDGRDAPSHASSVKGPTNPGESDPSGYRSSDAATNPSGQAPGISKEATAASAPALSTGEDRRSFGVETGRPSATDRAAGALPPARSGGEEDPIGLGGPRRPGRLESDPRLRDRGPAPFAASSEEAAADSASPSLSAQTKEKSDKPTQTNSLELRTWPQGQTSSLETAATQPASAAAVASARLLLGSEGRPRGDRSFHAAAHPEAGGIDLDPTAPSAPLLAGPPQQTAAPNQQMLRVAETILRDTLLPSAEEGGATLRLDPGGARISLRETGAGGIALDLRMHQGTLDIKASGSAASLLSSHENDLRAALLGAGLRLGQLSVASPDRPAAAAALAEADEAKRRFRTEASKFDRPSVEGGTHHPESTAEEGAKASIHIKA